MKGIISFDMDMTLLDHETWKIPESADRALHRLRENYYIYIATGRDLDSKFSEGLKELVNPDGIIHMNGTKITVGDKLIHEQFMAPEMVKHLLDFAWENGFAVGMATGTSDYFTNPDIIIESDKMRWGESQRTFIDPYELLNQKIYTLTYIGPSHGTRVIEAAFPQLKLPLFSNNQGADVVEREVSKADGLGMVCEYYGMNLSQTIAFGDSMNDYEILKTAGIGVAMGNSIPSLKEVADYVTTTIGEDGIWNACVALKLF